MKFFEICKEDFTLQDILQEGWGFTLSLLVPGLNIHNLLKTAKFSEINKNPKFVKYVNMMAKKVLAKEKKENPNLILIKKFTEADRKANSFLDDIKIHVLVDTNKVPYQN